MSAMHFYTSRTDEPAAGYASEGITGYVFKSQEAETTALYRWRHPESNLHFYTVDESGEAAPALGYVLEKTECYVFSAAHPETKPVYRWYHAESGDHLYTLGQAGELGPSSGYVPEGVVWHLYPDQKPGTTALFRWAAGEQTYCIQLTRNGMVVFGKNYSAASFEEAQRIAGSAKTEFDGMYGATDAHPRVKLGGC